MLEQGRATYTQMLFPILASDVRLAASLQKSML